VVGKVGSEVLGERPMHHGQFGTGSDLGGLLVNLSVFEKKTLIYSAITKGYHSNPKDHSARYFHYQLLLVGNLHNPIFQNHSSGCPRS